MQVLFRLTLILLSFAFYPLLTWSQSNYFEFNQHNDHQVQLPHQYELHKKNYEQRGQIIPESASQSKNHTAFVGHVLSYHANEWLKQRDWLGLKKMKKVQTRLSEARQMGSGNFKITPKVDAQKLSATLNIESYLNSRIWTENAFTTVRSQVELFKKANQLISLEHFTNRQESRTYLNLQRNW